MLQTLSFVVFCIRFSFDSTFCLTGMRNDWCFLCEFQTHVERASQSRFPFSPMNIISRLTNIGGTLGYGRQEDAHEFMRSVSLAHENS
jgi:ubiquitin carboxyl-terminal hydrolase 36/42